MSLIAHTKNHIAESGLVPDVLVRAGIRKLCSQRRDEICDQNGAELTDFVERMNAAPVALVPELANEQHYEVPADFFDLVLGAHRKYSCCYWGGGITNLDEAEQQSLAITCQRAKLRDGMNILELGCGWGSLSLWMASHYPNSNVTSVSNSASQKEFIEKEAASLGLTNIRVITADMNDFSIDSKFDRVVSLEMFEHMRNYGELFGRISRWLNPEGLFFMHIFCHRSAAYEYVDRGPADWMSRHFFSGGIMPSGDLPARFQEDLQLVDQWRWSGKHYQQTAEAWLRNMDERRYAVMPVLEDTYGKGEARKWFARWRIFFLAVSEMFGMDGGREWGVGHYLFRPKAQGQ
jgi:cyclopropane-fatty-acyl-phospholipid synthase